MLNYKYYNDDYARRNAVINAMIYKSEENNSTLTLEDEL
jgi:hypothetical protein